MLLDKQLKLCEDQTINTSENSDNVVDMGAAVALGQGEPCWMVLQVDSEANTDNTLVCTLYGADNEAMTTNKVAIGGGVINKLAADDVPLHKFVPLGATAKKRYYRAEFTVGGTGPSMVCSLWLSFGDQPQLSHSTQGAVT